MSRFTMHLERNLNPGLSKLYIVSGVLMIMVAILAARLLPGLVVAALIVAGALSIVGGYFRH